MRLHVVTSLVRFSENWNVSGCESQVLKSALPRLWEKVTTLAFYMVSTGEPAMYCEDWLAKSESLPCGNMSSQKISELLSAIGVDERMLFYEK